MCTVLFWWGLYIFYREILWPFSVVVVSIHLRASLPNRYSGRAEGLWRMRWHAHSLFSSAVYRYGSLSLRGSGASCLLQWSVIYFVFLANRRNCNLVSKETFPKSDCKCELVTFRCFKELGFCFENQSAIMFQSLWFHARKLDYWSSFLVMEVRRQDKGDIHPIRYLI